MNPFFSIIIVSLNPGDSLLATIDSVLQQTFDDYEIIIKDAGSTDGSLKKIPDDRRIRVITCSDNGLYHAMNQAIPHAGGKYFFFLNCGDYFYDNSVLEKTHQTAESRSTPCVLYGDCLYENLKRKRVPPKEIKDYFWSVSNICHQAVFFSADSLNADHTYDLSYRISADNEFYCLQI